MILFVCALLTVVIETPWMHLWGLRKRDEILLVICVNIATNLLLNLGLSLGFGSGGPGALIYLFEAIVVAVEYAVYALALGGGWKLFAAALTANCLSYGIGLLVF
ncbi:MAG: hypothetical protein IJY96_02525 [Oscillospiraceae bacterium]|nr:hypothetical protein [Oscillospiraceae bacterium]